MEKQDYLRCISAFLVFCLCEAYADDRKVTIVYMGSLQNKNSDYLPTSHHISMLEEVLEGATATDCLIRSYKRSFNGFAANLSEGERNQVANMEGVVSVFLSKILELKTTRSWNFMGFTDNVRRNLSEENDIIIGLLDTGIWPESDSFKDSGFGPLPKKWKGICNGGNNFTCNNKLIGARYYNGVGDSARDNEGHGTHTASTAAGNKVDGVSFYGLLEGTARGGVPSSRIAVYKVCQGGCTAVNVLNGFDDAIADGVDIISISAGFGYGEDLSSDPIAIGSFHAMERGILTSNSVGNNGPSWGSVESVAPWIFSVAAGSTDREIIDTAVLGNGKTIIGKSVNTFANNGTLLPLVIGKNASNCSNDFLARSCLCLNRSLVSGKIVLCEMNEGTEKAFEAGASGVIVGTFNPPNTVVPFPQLFLNGAQYDYMLEYANSPCPQAKILPSEVIHDPTGPKVAQFSSRGPNFVVPGIIKPDILAPGSSILAAYSPIASPSNSDDKRRVNYTIMSGTSMACPHVSGAAAYVKTFHPDWTPSAIKSALMTTAWPMNHTQDPQGEFAYGTGHIDPIKATDPGLVYETVKNDYVKFLCSIGFTEEKVRKITGDDIACPQSSNQTSPADLNYPSLGASIPTGKPFVIKFNRVVKNVGNINSTYKAEIISNPKLNITVEPNILFFQQLNELMSFVVTVSGQGLDDYSMTSASLLWSDGTHKVRSPIVVYTQYF